MKIDEKKLDSLRSEIGNILEQNNLKEDAIQKLIQIGLDEKTANDLFDSFAKMKNAEKTAENVWESSLKSTSGVDFTTDITKTRERASNSKNYFEQVNERSALIVAIAQTNPKEIDDELLEFLYKEGIEEQQINNPALKTCFRYYKESKQVDELKGQLSKSKQLVETMEQENRSLMEQIRGLKVSYKKLQGEFFNRIKVDEGLYQSAITVIEELKRANKELQEKGLFKSIRERFQRKRNPELTEATTNLPESLMTRAEKMGIAQSDTYLNQQGINNDRGNYINRTHTAENVR